MKIFIGNLANITTEEDLVTEFSKFGDVGSAIIIKDKLTGESRRFGFVIIADKSRALSAIENLNGKELDGRKIIVNRARNRIVDYKGKNKREGVPNFLKDKNNKF